MLQQALPMATGLAGSTVVAMLEQAPPMATGLAGSMVVATRNEEGQLGC